MIVTVGDAIVDLFALPRGCEVADAEQFVPRQGGAPANVAVVAARLGAAARFVGAVGNDAHGRRLVRALREAGVDTESVITLPHRTGVTFVRVGLDGARSFLFYRQGGADLSLAPEHLDALARSPLEDARWLHFMSSALVVDPMAAAARHVLAACVAREVPLSLDLNVRAHLWSDRVRMVDETRSLAARAVLVKASEEDLEALGLPTTLDALRSLCTAPAAIPVLTLADRGVVVSIDGAELAVPAPEVSVVDATGAGDAFVAAMLAGLEARALRPSTRAWSDRDAWRSVLALACSVGARAVTALGATEALQDVGEARSVLAAWRADSSA